MKPERLPNRENPGGVHEALAHDSAELHVSGEARYVDDLPEPPGTLYAALGMSSETCAEIRAIDLDPVRRAPGVVGVAGVDPHPGAAADHAVADGVVVGSAPIVLGKAVLRMTSPRAVGTHTVTARYEGDGTFAAGTSAAKRQTVTLAAAI